MSRALSLIAFLLIIIGAVWYLVTYLHPQQLQTPQTQQPISTVMYQCDGGKSIQASFYAGTSTPSTSPTQPPVPGGKAMITLSDGRTMTLPQTISADGARYSNGNPQVAGSETFVFWSKGNGALVLENNQQQTYQGCIEVAKDPGGLPQVYESGSHGFSMRFPEGYSVDDQYKYQELGPGKTIYGVKFQIASSTAAGTNLSPDTYLSVEEIPQTTDCNAGLFLDSKSLSGPVSTTTIDGTDYSVASSTGAGAGNRYEEDVFTLPGTNPCLAVRYFIHWGVLQNYPTGSVKQFDEQALKQTFDAMRKTLIVNQ